MRPSELCVCDSDFKRLNQIKVNSACNSLNTLPGMKWVLDNYQLLL